MKSARSRVSIFVGLVMRSRLRGPPDTFPALDEPREYRRMGVRQVPGRGDERQTLLRVTAQPFQRLGPLGFGQLRPVALGELGEPGRLVPVPPAQPVRPRDL